MKLRIVDRIVAAVAGLLLAALSLIPLLDFLANTRFFARLAEISEVKSASHIIFMVGGGIVVLLMGILCLRVAFRRGKRKDFVVQSTDVGELSISIKAIEDLVNQCVSKHDELHVSSTTLENTRDGLVIGMRVGLANGVNIPLAVNALQKQIKQYVTACSGVDVHEVKVQVDTTAAKGNASVYAVPDMLENVTLPREEKLVTVVETQVQAEEIAEVKEEKCLHQRLFGEEEQPAIVPMPPVEEVADAEEAANEQEAPVEETAEAQKEEAVAEEAPAAEEPAEDAAEPAELETLSGLTLEVEESEAAAEEVESVEEAEEISADETAAEDEADYEVEDIEAEEEAAGFVADEDSIAELEALDGAEDFAEEEETEESAAPAEVNDEEAITPEA